MDGCTLAAAKRFEVDKVIVIFIYDWLPACNNGYPLTKKINKWCSISISVIRFSVTVDAVFNPYVLVSFD